MRQRVRALDPNVPVRLATLASTVSGSVAPRRFAASVIATFAALALLLAAVGIHGVLAYVVAQRRREIGVRMALGAARGTVRGMVLRDAMRAVLPGVVAGLAGALVLSRVLRGMLYGVSATDPAVLASVAVLLTLVAVAAAWMPARHATRVDPLEAMRADCGHGALDTAPSILRRRYCAPAAFRRFCPPGWIPARGTGERAGRQCAASTAPYRPRRIDRTASTAH